MAKNIVQLESVYSELKDAMMALAKARAWDGCISPMEPDATKIICGEYAHDIDGILWFNIEHL